MKKIGKILTLTLLCTAAVLSAGKTVGAAEEQMVEEERQLTTMPEQSEDEFVEETSVKSAKTSKSLLKAPAELTSGSLGWQAVKLYWSEVQGAVRYQIEYSTDGKNYTVVGKTKNLKYKCKNLLTGQDYYFRVCAVDRSGKAGAYSAELKVTPFLKKSAFLDTSVNNQTISLEWKSIPGAEGYLLHRKSIEEKSWHRAALLKETHYQETLTESGITYQYRVRAYRTVNGKKVYGKFAKVAELKLAVVEEPKEPVAGEQEPEPEAPQVPAALAAPELLSVKNTTNRSLSLAWKKVENATGYCIYRSQNAAKSYTLLAEITGGDVVGYEDRTTVPGVTYYYEIKATYTDGKLTEVSEADNYLSGTVAPSAPIGVSIRQNATDELDISWESSTGASSYQLYRAASGNGKYTCIAENISDTHYLDTGLVSGKTYYYRVAASQGTLASVQSNAVSFPVDGVMLSSRTLKVCKGMTKSLSVNTFREGEPVWKSSNPKVAVVDDAGNVTGVAYGTATITVTVSGKSAASTVSVTTGTKNGIDVSVWQKDVDWMKVKASGVDFAFLRISNHYLEDYTFETKYANAIKAGMPLGVYCYSRAVNAEEAQQEARTVLQILNGRALDYPIVMDLEDASQKKLSKVEISQMITAFSQVVEDAGYSFALYSYMTFLNSYVDKTKLEGIDLWIARYRQMALGTGYTGAGNLKYWQYNSGQFQGTDYHVDGITDEAGNLVNADVNIEY